MPDDSFHRQVETPHPMPRRRPARAPRGLRLIGVVTVIVAAAAAAWGITRRQEADRQLRSWTDAQAVPTVAVAPPVRSTAPRQLVLPGDVQAFYEAPIYARVSGYLQSWSQDIGAHVRAGQVLATIDTPDLDQDLIQAQADLATAQANSSLAELTAKRWRALLGSNSVSQQSVDEKSGDAMARRAMVNAQMAHVNRLRALEAFKRLVAPFDGIVTARNTDVGALISSGSDAAKPLFRVADMHAMRVYVRVPQAYASDLAPRLHATLSEPQYPGAKFPATLATTSQSVAEDSRTVLVELMAPNPDGKLWPGTYADVTFQIPGDSQALRIPASALIFRTHGAQVAVVTPDHHVTLKDITIGRNLGEEIEVAAGLAPGDQVVTSPLDTIADGQLVDIATK